MNLSQKRLKDHDLAVSQINTLYDIKELLIYNTKYGEIIGHYASNKYFFYSNGKRVFIHPLRHEAINFLKRSYTLKAK